MTAQADRNAVPEDLDLEAALRVLDAEARGLAALAEALDQSFINALDRLEAVSGRVIVTGMGKSGHVARKIAATLASTGTPALFVHSGEASHGDLGMITSKDAVLALSNSGNTRELSAIIAYTRRYAIPLIGMTSKADSALAEQADLALILPAAPEACPMGLSPTTSTTMMMALGDALSIALLERKGFSPQDFQVFHPGGSLGQNLLRVADIMHGPKEMPLCSKDTIMAEAILTMTNKHFGCVGVADDQGRLIGIITDGDLRRSIETGGNLLQSRAGEVMTADPVTIVGQALAAEAIGLMNTRAITSLFVAEGPAEKLDRPIGILHIQDCLRAGIS